ncbi:MAG: DUF262 domain-containing protein [Chloroflexi bacterium]|nr:DUF262 domain-containing protein [Chloroflexota bacterium]MBP8058880.1 DUF262 domain-containing protein [Chloroflexota bacterium]
MSIYSDRIKPTDYHIRSYLEDLLHKKYQIPTFQREVVWERDSVKKLWDSIYRFYPIGSVLIWKTNLKLQNHRSIGGHVIADNNVQDSFQYILDGQQRTTSLLTSLYGGQIEGQEGFDPTLYFDLTVEDVDEIDDQTFRNRFLFWDDIDDRDGRFLRNVQRMNRFREGLIVKLLDVLKNFGVVEKKLVEGQYGDYDDPIRKRLRDIRDVLDNYRLSFIELKGIEVSEVCQIFERINQAGKPLDIFDIVVAKTFRLATGTRSGFYLRELIGDFRQKTPGNFSSIDDLTYLQIVSMIINQEMPDSGILNVTPIYLNRLRTDHIETIWPGAKKAIQKMFDFFDNHLHLKGPKLIPNRYFYLTIANHFYNNPRPDYDFLKQYFWFISFHNEDLLTNTTHMRQQVIQLAQAKTPGSAQLERFLIDKDRLRTASYSTRGRLSTAILALLANQEPRDWENTDRHVLGDLYYALTDKPNLHHVFPVGYMENNPGSNKIDVNSLMNIAYITQITNLKIRARNPLAYLRDYDSPEFEAVLKNHLIPPDVLGWARDEEMPDNAFDIFINKRIDLFIELLRQKLTTMTFDVVDTTSGEST